MFADEAENFCDTLLNAEDCSVEDLEECINDLRDLSQRALVETGEMSRMFKSNRQNFFDVWTRLKCRSHSSELSVIDHDVYRFDGRRTAQNRATDARQGEGQS